MHFSSVVAPFLSLAAPAMAETIFGVVVFSRHGDRTSKHYPGYGLTNVGENQNYQVGTAFRNRYLAANSPQRIFNISQDKYTASQVYASAPNQNILLNTATRFLQGLYPPLAAVNSASATQTLVNGTTVQAPLGGYQYVVLTGEDSKTPDTIWIKGADMCPAVTRAQLTFENSTVFADNVARTRDFYAGFWDIMQNVYDYTTQAKLTYAKAYDIFDLINTASTQNRSIPRNVSSDELFQLRTLADSAEFGYNFNASMKARSIGGQTMGGAILNQLNQTVSTQGKLKFSLLAGSYNTVLSFFGLANLTAASPDFFGLPGYASTLTFELFSSANNVTSFPTDLNTLNVRFVFKNGSDASFTTFPLFGRAEDSIPWPQFVTQMQNRTITTVQGWCNACGVTDSFCLQYASSTNSAGGSGSSNNNGSSSKGGMSNAVAGVIGAFVTLGVLAILGALAFLLFRRKNKTARAAAPMERKASGGSSSASA